MLRNEQAANVVHQAYEIDQIQPVLFVLADVAQLFTVEELGRSLALT